jgi:hypothetical protein
VRTPARPSDTIAEPRAKPLPVGEPKPAAPAAGELLRAAQPKPKAEPPQPDEEGLKPKAPAPRAPPEPASQRAQANAREKSPAEKPAAATQPPEKTPDKPTKRAATPEAQKPAPARAADRPQDVARSEPKPATPDGSDGADFSSVRKTLQDMKQKDRAAPAAASDSARTRPAGDGDALASRVSRALQTGGVSAAASSLPVTAGEVDSVRRQIERCWSLPAGLKGRGKDLTVSIRVEMNIDGTPRTALIENAGRMDADIAYRATAESAKRAVLNPRCQPFKLPPEKYERWRTLTLVFNPAEMVGT